MSWTPGAGALNLGEPPAEGFGEADVDLSGDAVIVGSGPGGAAAARELTLRGMSVVLLEEGPPKSRFARNYATAMRHHMQEGGAMVATGTGYLPIAAGRGIGGGSLINSAIAWRAPDAVLDAWTPLLGHDRFGARAMAPVYDALWEMLGIGVNRVEVMGRNNAIVVEGAAKLGIEGGYLERATPGCVGCGVCYYGCPTQGKASVNLNLVADAVAGGARIQADCKVDVIEVEGDRAVGVRGRLQDPDTRAWGGTVRVRATHIVIAAGGVGTPRLLHHAGLAARLGPAVGEGLHLHPGSAVLGFHPEPVELWKGATQGAYFHPPDLPGVLPHSFSAPPEACLAAMEAVGPRLKEGIARMRHLCGLVVMVSDTGTGTVRAWPDGRARISYTFAEDDIRRIRAGMVWSARVLLAGGVTEIFAPVHGLGRMDSAEEMERRLAMKDFAAFTLYASHPMSSCRMGADPATSVVRPDGRAHTVENLWIADSSVFPTSLGVNPSITTMALAALIARGIA